MRRSLSLMLICGAVAAQGCTRFSSPPEPEPPWNARGNSAGTAVSTSPPVAAVTEVLWQVRTSVHSMLSLADGRLFYLDRSFTLHALNASTGQALWSGERGLVLPEGRSADEGKFRVLSTRFVSPVATERQVHSLEVRGKDDFEVVTRDSATGARVRSLKIGNALVTPVLTGQAMAVVDRSSPTSIVRSLDEHGTSRWSYEVTAEGEFDNWLWLHSPIGVSDVVLVPIENGVTALTGSTGTPLWTFGGAEERGDVRASVNGAAATHDTVVFGMQGGHYYAVALQTGVQKRRLQPREEFPATPPVLDGETVYVGWGGALRAVDLRTGLTRWEAVFEPRSRSSSGDTKAPAWLAETLPMPIKAGDFLYVGGAKGLYAIDADTGKTLWTFETDSAVVSGPAIHSGILYFATEDYLYAIR